MGRKRATPALEAAAAVLSAAAGNPSIEDDEDLEAAEISEDVLEGLRRLDQGGNRVTWYVYSDTPGKSGDSEGYVEKLKTEHLDEQRFKSRYGPGEYRVMGRTSDGHYVKGSHKVIKISDIGAEAPAAAVAPSDALTLMRELRTADEARQRARDESLKTYATILAAPLATLGAALIGRRPAIDIAALVTALKPAQSAPSLNDMTTALVNLKALQGSDSGGGNVELVLKVLERLPDLPQGTQGEGGWLGFVRDLIKEAAPHARELFANRTPAGQLPPGSTTGAAFGPGVSPGAVLPRPAPAPANGGSPPTPSASAASPPSSSDSGTNPSEANEMWRIAEPWLRRRAQDLHEWAAANMEVELCAEMLLASVPKLFSSMLSPQELAGFLEHPQWWVQLTAFHPPLQPYHAWIDDARQELLSLLQEQANGPPPAAPDERGTTQ